MPATKKPLKASRRKVWIHTFYLCQPFLQFFALIAVMVVLTRCSPLAPSTPKNPATQSPAMNENAGLAEAAALEDVIQKSLREISAAELTLVSRTEADRLTKDVPHTDDALEERDVRTLFQKREDGLRSNRGKKQKLLFVPLDTESQETFLQNGYLRIDLSQRLEAHTKEKARKAWLQHLLKSLEDGNLKASTLLVLANGVKQSGDYDELRVKIKVSLGIPSDDKAYIEIRRSEDDDNAPLLNAALQEAEPLAILLE